MDAIGITAKKQEGRFGELARLREENVGMRIGTMIVSGSLAVSAALALPAWAKHTPPQKAEEKSTSSSSCHAYQAAPDGTWTVVPCQEIGGQTQHRPPAKSQEEEPR